MRQDVMMNATEPPLRRAISQMLQLEYRLSQVKYTRDDARQLRFSVSKQVTSQIAANRVIKGVLANNHELSHHPVCPKQLLIAIPASLFPMTSRLRIAILAMNVPMQFLGSVSLDSISTGSGCASEGKEMG